jgi:aspartate/methionine/tyrosine aminotransferase
MFFSILMFGEPGAEIMYPNPGFPIYESVIRFSGATPVPIELHEATGFSFSADEVLGRITDKTRLIIVNTPANPTGGIVSTGELDKFTNGLEDFPHVTVLSDEIYSRMLYDGHTHKSLLSYPALRDRLIVLDGWSKTYAMTGWRLGWSLWPDTLAPLAAKLAVNDHSCVNAATQWAGIAALEGPQEAVDDMVRAFDERRRLIVGKLNALPGFSCVTPLGAFYAFPNITGTGKSAGELQDAMLNEANVATVAGTSFGALGEGYVRFSYAASAPQIEEAMARIAKIL